ncbi:hypothetical protein B0H11DRAFT_2004280 [Mycena galericulata]|nr:hypothetical protein B0H11DRAFT_2004280 [Mycena galericulata]
MVAFVWCCEMAHVICSGDWLYRYTISDYGKPELLIQMPPSLITLILLSSMVAACVQVFFSVRIYHLSRSLFIPGLCWLFSFLRIVGAAVEFGAGLKSQSLTAYVSKWGWLFEVGWSIAFSNDLIIAGTMAYLLFKQRNGAQKKTLAIVDKLIKWTLETGILTSAAGLITLAAFLADRDGWIWASWWVIQARLFSNSLLARLNYYLTKYLHSQLLQSLNSRQTLRTMKNQTTMPIPLSVSSHQIEIGRFTDPATNFEGFQGHSESKSP